jgi:hypothetical protein
VAYNAFSCGHINPTEGFLFQSVSIAVASGQPGSRSVFRVEDERTFPCGIAPLTKQQRRFLARGVVIVEVYAVGGTTGDEEEDDGGGGGDGGRRGATTDSSARSSRGQSRSANASAAAAAAAAVAAAHAPSAEEDTLVGLAKVPLRALYVELKQRFAGQQSALPYVLAV